MNIKQQNYFKNIIYSYGVFLSLKLMYRDKQEFYKQLLQNSKKLTN
jgi:hypothetical protein